MASSKPVILENARTLFAESGFKGTTIAQISKMSNVTDAAIYRHFRSKQQLFECIINHFLDEFKVLADNVQQRQKSGYCLIETLILDLDKFMAQRVTDFKVIMSTYTIMDNARNVMDRIYALLEETLVRCLEKGILDTTVRADINVPTTASLIAVMLIALGRHQVYWPEAPQLAAEAVEFCQRSLRSV